MISTSRDAECQIKTKLVKTAPDIRELFFDRLAKFDQYAMSHLWFHVLIIRACVSNMIINNSHNLFLSQILIMCSSNVMSSVERSYNSAYSNQHTVIYKFTKIALSSSLYKSRALTNFQ